MKTLTQWTLSYCRYTMLLGRPPFETTNLKETYKCIREARYSLPSSLSPQAKQLISSLLAKIPEDRPNLDHILRHDFFTQVRHCSCLHFCLCSVCLILSKCHCVGVQLWPPILSAVLTHFSSPQGFSPERLPVSCCHSAPDFHISSPAKSFFKKAAAALFGGKRDKVRYYETLSEYCSIHMLFGAFILQQSWICLATDWILHWISIFLI